MKLIARGMAFALALLPALAHAEDKATPKQPTSKDAARTDANPMNTPNIGAKASSTADEKMTDARLVALLHEVNQEEISAGKLAEQKGHSAQVKEFGKQLVQDHTKSDTDVKAAAKKAGISMSESALSSHDKEMMKTDKNKMDQLKKMSGAEFDHTFAQVMSKDHDHMISMLRDHKDDLKSQDLKKLVDDTIPVLQQHKDMADRAGSSAQAKSGSDQAGSPQGRSPGAIERPQSTTSPRAVPDTSTPSTSDKSTSNTGEKSSPSSSDKK